MYIYYTCIIYIYTYTSYITCTPPVVYIYILAQLRTQNSPNSAPLLFCQGRSGIDQELRNVAQGRFLDGNTTVKNLVRNG